jgi:hypothetical protein
VELDANATGVLFWNHVYGESVPGVDAKGRRRAEVDAEWGREQAPPGPGASFPPPSPSLSRSLLLLFVLGTYLPQPELKLSLWSRRECLPPTGDTHV